MTFELHFAPDQAPRFQALLAQLINANRTTRTDVLTALNEIAASHTAGLRPAGARLSPKRDNQGRQRFRIVRQGLRLLYAIDTDAGKLIVQACEISDPA